jgi:hypothetical protein
MQLNIKSKWIALCSILPTYPHCINTQKYRTAPGSWNSILFISSILYKCCLVMFPLSNKLYVHGTSLWRIYADHSASTIILPAPLSSLFCWDPIVNPSRCLMGCFPYTRKTSALNPLMCFRRMRKCPLFLPSY